MVYRREKLSRVYRQLREQTFYKQVVLLSDSELSLSTAEISAIKNANHSPSMYDRLYSHTNGAGLSIDLETMVQRITGQRDANPRNSEINHRKRSRCNSEILRLNITSHDASNTDSECSVFESTNTQEQSPNCCGTDPT